jgi:hypothetical protein
VITKKPVRTGKKNVFCMNNKRGTRQEYIIQSFLLELIYIDSINENKINLIDVSMLACKSIMHTYTPSSPLSDINKDTFSDNSTYWCIGWEWKKYVAYKGQNIADPKWQKYFSFCLSYVIATQSQRRPIIKVSKRTRERKKTRNKCFLYYSPKWYTRFFILF